MRLAAALAVVAVAFSAAVYVHERHIWVSSAGPPTASDPFGVASGSHSVHPSWEDPAAVGIAIGGLAIAAGILAARRKTFAKPS